MGGTGSWGIRICKGYCPEYRNSTTKLFSEKTRKPDRIRFT